MLCHMGNKFQLVVALALTFAACGPSDDMAPPAPHPVGFAGENWEAYKVKSYQSIEPEYAYNPFDKQREIWQEYRLTLRVKPVFD